MYSCSLALVESASHADLYLWIYICVFVQSCICVFPNVESKLTDSVSRLTHMLDATVQCGWGAGTPNKFSQQLSVSPAKDAAPKLSPPIIHQSLFDIVYRYLIIIRDLISARTSLCNAALCTLTALATFIISTLPIITGLLLYAVSILPACAKRYFWSLSVYRSISWHSVNNSLPKGN